MITTRDAAAPLTAPPSPAATRHRTTRRLLTCGLLAGPVLLGTGLAQVYTRDGFDLDRHALSQLALGTWGFVQILNFLVTGVLVIAAARGLRDTLGSNPTSVWGTRLLTGFGTGMLIAGVFVADPGHGFPAGTPAGQGPLSWHGALHGLGFAVAMASWTAAMIALAATRGDRTQTAICVAALLAAATVAVAPSLGSFGHRAIVLSAIQLTAVALLCAKALRTNERNTPCSS